jgi:hypothetical protein
MPDTQPASLRWVIVVLRNNVTALTRAAGQIAGNDAKADLLCLAQENARVADELLRDYPSLAGDTTGRDAPWFA